MPTPSTEWQMSGDGYEFCNCDFGCGCNFGGFPNSKDGSCRALVGLHIAQGRGDVKLDGMPWELLGPTFEVVGLEKVKITIEGQGRKSVFKMEGIGEGRGDTFKNRDRRRASCRPRAARRLHLDQGRVRRRHVQSQGRPAERVLRQDQLDFLQVRLEQLEDCSCCLGRSW